MLMREKKYALEVYNALNLSHYTDPEEIQICILENGIQLSIRNDASFILDHYMSLYEHQASYNPNMPLRGLIYYSNLIEKLVKKKNLYGRNLIKIPTPTFVVFYNGMDKRPEIEQMRLSDAFEQPVEDPQLELKCMVYNINPGYNQELLNNCRVLREYQIVIETIKQKYRQMDNLEEAIESAIDECIRKDVLAEFLKEHREAVMKVTTLDYTWERLLEFEHEEAKEEGRLEGRLEERKCSILEALGEYCEIPETIKEIIEKEDDLEKLKKWNRAANRAESLEEFIDMAEMEI